jgi:glycosyltransferase involved in cell wall biosynthesis
MQNILTSIIIPCYNQSNWLSEAIESSLNQTYKNIEVIVVNDGSTDNTSEIAKKYNIKLIEKENGGLSSARNAGIKEARGKYILPLDADDKILPEFIEKTIGLDDIVSTAQQEFGDSNTLWNTQPEHPSHEMFKSNNQINCCALHLKEIWEDIGGYDEKMTGYEDWDYWYRATKNGYTITVIREPLFLYRKHGHSMVTDAIKRHEELKQYILNK